MREPQYAQTRYFKLDFFWEPVTCVSDVCIENELYLPVYKLHIWFPIFGSQHKINLHDVQVAY
jgi:hypothetical protein